VIVDLEGAASLLMSYAISMADLVVIPCKARNSTPGRRRQIDLIKFICSSIPFTVVFTRTNPAIIPKTQRHVEARFAELKVPVLHTKLYDREAYRAMFSYGGTLAGLEGKVSNLHAAIKNAHAFVSEVLWHLRAGQGSAARIEAKEVA
jgi:chromosome partitioning protein